MIEASFSRSSRTAAVSGVYQYDTGQRLKMHGLPSPDELLAGDDLLSGDIVAVQAQFGYEGDEQTEMRLAQWSDEHLCWLVDIPDEYLTRIDPVHVYVYVDHGGNEEISRARTMYEGVFSPIGRPAPSNFASEDMLEQWAELEAEVDLVLSGTGTAIESANTNAANASAAAQAAKDATASAQSAAGNANNGVRRLEAVESLWNNATVKTVDLAAGSSAYATLSGNTLTYGIPRGANGAKGATGDTGPADIALSISDGVLTITPR